LEFAINALKTNKKKMQKNASVGARLGFWGTLRQKCHVQGPEMLV
jgi:hypothetical protein